METTEKIVEAYVRYVKRWATIPNIRCDGQFEIDLLAIDPVTLARYHIETGVSVSQVYSKLTVEKFDPVLLKQRGHVAKMRRTLGYFTEHKFEPAPVIERLKEYGFNKGKYTKVVVTWDATPEAKAAAAKAKIEIWDFREIMRKIDETIRGKRSYFTDDTLRTIGLFARATSAVEPALEIETVTKKAKPKGKPKPPHFQRRAD
jgi:hypothetical protein